jgi:inorganic pyrophosphatase
MTAADLLHLRSDTFPEEIPVLVEIPQGSSIKYELDKKSGVMLVDRFLHTAMVYPFNYGFIPDTKALDGDPVDVLLISAQPVIPGSAVLSRPIGLLEMEDEAGIDEKIIAVPTKDIDPWYAKILDVHDLDEATHEKIRHFFNHYKELEPGKWVRIRNFLGKEQALAAIRKST